jgi:hypothetical protein
VTFVLSLFLLASGTMFYEKIVQSFAKLSEKKLALRVVYDVEREISRYLFTIATINCALGLVVAVGLWTIGLPQPVRPGHRCRHPQFPTLCRGPADDHLASRQSHSCPSTASLMR